MYRWASIYSIGFMFLRYITLFAINIESSVYLVTENQSDLYYLFITTRALNVWAANHSAGATPPTNSNAAARRRGDASGQSQSEAQTRGAAPLNPTRERRRRRRWLAYHSAAAAVLNQSQGDDYGGGGMRDRRSRQITCVWTPLYHGERRIIKCPRQFTCVFELR
jgi:hypothetical protein